MRVRRTRNPSFKQIQNMTANLKTKFSNNANIQTITQSGETKFWISNGEDFFGWLDKWSDLQVIYFELMRRKGV